MASVALFRSPHSFEVNLCARGAITPSNFTSKTSRRRIGLKYLAKQDAAKAAWNNQAEVIKNGQKKSMLSILEERGLVYQIAGGREKLDALMTSKRLGAYVGIDPSASSLHVGNIVPLMALFWMYVHGFHTISLLGGATAKVGDPTDRLKSREQQDRHLSTANMVRMHYQLKKLWLNVEKYGEKYGYKWEWAWRRGLVNNNTWMNKLGIMEVLLRLGPGLRMGTLLARETVKNKMEKGDGMSFAEFTYPLLQAWDWWHMYNTLNIQIQIGGSDQFGNIVAGIDAVKYLSDHHPNPDIRGDKYLPENEPLGFTVPLLTTASGAKFGKSAGNAIWLDKEQTSTFDLYAFFVRTDDADVERYLKLFTFLPLSDIAKAMEEHRADPKRRVPHHLLAREFVELAHGEIDAIDAQARHRLLHTKTNPLSPSDTSAALEVGVASVSGNNHVAPGTATLNSHPLVNVTLPRSILDRSIGRILHAAGMAESATEAHRLVSAGGVYIGGKSGQKEEMPEAELKFTPIKNWAKEDTSKFLINGRILILRRGKHNIRIVDFVEDAKFENTSGSSRGSQELAMDMIRKNNADEEDVKGARNE